MSRKCIYSDGKGNTVVMPARKTYFKQLTTTTQKPTTIILRDPPPITPSQIQTAEITTIGIAGPAIIAFALLALLLAVVLNRRRKSTRESVVVVYNNNDHVYDEIGKQEKQRSCFPLMVKKKGDKIRPSQNRPALHPRRTAETNIYDCIEGYDRCRPAETVEIVQVAGNSDSPVELKDIVEQNKSPNPYFELENENAIGPECHESSTNPYFELENENTHPGYFQLEKEATINSDVPNPYFVLEEEVGGTRDPGRRHCSCGNRPNVPDQYARANLYRPISLPCIHHKILYDNRRNIETGAPSNNADICWSDTCQDSHTNPYEIASVESAIKDRMTETAGNNQYFVLDRDAHDSLNNEDKLKHIVNKDVLKLVTSFPVETDAEKIAGHFCQRRLDFNKGEYSHLYKHPEWDSTKPMSRLVSVDHLERLKDEGGITIIILPTAPDMDSTESANYDRIHFSPAIKPRSRLNSAPH